MNIGLDLRPSLPRPTGVGAYVLALAQRLPRARPAGPLLLLLGLAPRPLPAAAPGPPNVTLVDRRLPGARAEPGLEPAGLAARSTAWWARRCDLVHSPHPLLVPGKQGEARRHPPRPLLPQAPGHDGGRDPARLRAARARARAARGRRHLRVRVHGLRGAAAARRARRRRSR